VFGEDKEEKVTVKEMVVVGLRLKKRRRYWWIYLKKLN